MPIQRTLPSVRTDGTSSARETATVINTLRQQIIDLQDKVRWYAADDPPDGSQVGYPIITGYGSASADSAVAQVVTPGASSLVLAIVAARAAAAMPGTVTLADDLASHLGWAQITSAAYDDGSGDRLLLSLWSARAPSAPTDMVLTATVTGAAATVIMVGEIACPPTVDLTNAAGGNAADGNVTLALPRVPADISTVIAVDCTLGAYAVRPPSGFTNAGEISARSLTLGMAFKNQLNDQSFSWKAGGMKATAIAFEVSVPS